jgi:uncharacterized protein DUF4440
MSRMPQRRTAKAHYPRAVIPATELLPDLERRRLRALVSADMATAGPLHAEEYWLITPAGSGLTKDGYLEAVASGELGYRVFEPVSEITVLAGADLAVLRYQARISFDDSPGFVCWHTDCYRLRDGTWQVVWSQATAITPAASGAGRQTGS